MFSFHPNTWMNNWPRSKGPFWTSARTNLSNASPSPGGSWTTLHFLNYFPPFLIGRIRENCAAWWRFLRSQNKRNTVVCNRANSSQLKPFFIPLASRTEMSTKRKGTEHTFTFDLRFPILWRTIRAERSRIWNRVQLPANERAAGKFVRREQMRTGKRNATSLLWTVIRRVGRLLTALVIRLGLSLILNQSTPRLKSY